VCRKVDREAYADDDGDHGDGVDVDVPKWHETEDAHVDRQDGQHDPQRDLERRDEQRRHQHHKNDAAVHLLHSVWQHPFVLVHRRPHQVEGVDASNALTVQTTGDWLTQHQLVALCNCIHQ